MSQINQDTEIRRDAGYGCHRSTKTQRSGEIEELGSVTDPPKHRDQEMQETKELPQINQNTEIRRDTGVFTDQPKH